ncbi:MAG: TonB-dependent receptor [Hyphomicrobiaceae bacterium]
MTSPTRLVASRAALLSAIAVSAPLSPAHAQQNTSNQLPPVIVEQSKQPASKPKMPGSKVPSAPSGSASSTAVAKKSQPNPPLSSPPSATASAEPADGAAIHQHHEDLALGAGGLAKPATTTTIKEQSIAPERISTSDTATLLTKAPGVSIFQAGGVSGLPAINGLADDRVKIMLNGMAVTSACANHMNPPLSYIDPAQVGKVEVISGVTPVSKGGDSIAGTVIVESPPPHFAAVGEGVHTAGSISGFYRSNGDAVGTSGRAHAATENFSIDYTGAWVRSGNYEDGHGDEVRATLYQSQNHDVRVAIRNNGDLLIVQGGLQYIPYQGFVNQRMDMVENESWYLNTRYLAKYNWGKVDAKAFYRHVDHMMDFVPDKKFSGMMMREMPMRTDSEDAGYTITVEIPVADKDLLRIGSELQHSALDDWWPPVAGMMMMCCDPYITVNDGTRTRLGTFIEWERQWDRAWSTLLGVRNDMVWMDAGNVHGYNGGMMYGPDADAFNAHNHHRTDANFDVTALARFEPNAASRFEFGYAMKTRSPSFYERYAWSTSSQMAMNMITWFGDGNGYTGNLDLDPERAHTISFTAGWHSPDKGWGLKVTPYYTYVQDYIGVRKIGTQMSGDFVNLQFANHDAELFGVNVSGAVPLVTESDFGNFGLSAVAGYVHGENADTGVYLYHMMPFNTRVALTHRLGSWSTAIELDLVAGKRNVDTVRQELETSAYALVNLRTSYEWERWRFDLAVENVFDTYYENPLGGINMEEVIRGLPKSNVAGYGRSINVGATLKF